MITDMLELSPCVHAGLLMSIVLFALVIFVVFTRHQRILCKERERQKKKYQMRIDEITAERIYGLRERVINSTWIYEAADFVIKIKTPVKRIEIWKSQLIVEAESYSYVPLSGFGVNKELTSEEAYHANKVLHEIIRDRGYRQYILKDMELYCEIVKIR